MKEMKENHDREAEIQRTVIEDLSGRLALLESRVESRAPRSEMSGRGKTKESLNRREGCPFASECGGNLNGQGASGQGLFLGNVTENTNIGSFRPTIETRQNQIHKVMSGSGGNVRSGIRNPYNSPCVYCGQYGHWRKECPKRRKEQN